MPKRFLFILGDRENWLDAIGFMIGLDVQDFHQLFVERQDTEFSFTPLFDDGSNPGWEEDLRTFYFFATLKRPTQGVSIS